MVDSVSRSPNSVRAAVIYPDSTLESVALNGNDGALFAQIRRIVGSSVVAIEIDDHDGVAALGWVAEATQGLGLPANPVASTLADRPISGPMVVTGLGRGDEESITSIHIGLQAVLEQMSPRRRESAVHVRHSLG